MHLRPIPGSDHIVMACNNQSKELRYARWNGSRFVGDPALLLTTAEQPSERWLAFGTALSGFLSGPAAAPTPNGSL